MAPKKEYELKGGVRLRPDQIKILRKISNPMSDPQNKHIREALDDYFTKLKKLGLADIDKENGLWTIEN